MAMVCHICVCCRTNNLEEEVDSMRSSRGMAVVCVLCLLLGGLAVRPVLLGQTQPVDAAPGAVPKDLVSYRDIVKKVLPAVVSVEVVSKAPTNKAVANKPKNEDKDKADDRLPPLPFGDRSDDAMRKFME